MLHGVVVLHDVAVLHGVAVLRFVTVRHRHPYPLAMPSPEGRPREGPPCYPLRDAGPRQNDGQECPW